MTIKNLQKLTGSQENGDAYGDIVVTNNGSSNISVLNSTGPTTHAAAVTIAAGYTNPYAVVILDYDLDGKKDVIISSSNVLKTSAVVLSVVSITSSSSSIASANEIRNKSV